MHFHLIKSLGNETNTQPTGDVIIQDADVKLEGESVTLMPGTTIINSDVRINVDHSQQ